MAWMLPLKVLLISSCLVFMASLGLKLSVPSAMRYLSTSYVLVKNMWNSFLSLLRPPYLYLLLNCIIITIAAFSRFNHSARDETKEPPPPSSSEDISIHRNQSAEEMASEFATEMEAETADDSSSNASAFLEDEEEKRIVEMDSIFTEHQLSVEKPVLVSKPAVKINTQAREKGLNLKVTSPQQHETLENTWKAITEGRGLMKKEWETFNDRSNYYQPQPACRGTGGGLGKLKLRKEASLSQDELNQRVEDFINKFNEDMRLQRQESLQQYMEMISRGTQ